MTIVSAEKMTRLFLLPNSDFEADGFRRDPCREFSDLGMARQGFERIVLPCQCGIVEYGMDLTMAGAAEQGDAMLHLVLVKGQFGAVATMTRLRNQVMAGQRQLPATAELTGAATGGKRLFMIRIRDCSVQDCSVQTRRVRVVKNRLKV